MPKREVEIYEIELLSSNHDEFSFRAVVSKGTYIRSLIRDIGNEIKIPCTMSSLQRIRQGNFNIDEAITISDIENNNFKILPLERGLEKYPSIVVNSNLESKIENGSILDNIYNSDIIVFKNNNNEVLAIYKTYEKNIKKIKPIKVFKKI